MSDLLRILELGKQAINAHQSTMNTVGHNIANVNTEGFSRQRVNLTPTPPNVSLNNIFGSGVEVENVERVRNQFIDRQLRQHRPNLGQLEFMSDSLQVIEEMFNEPSEFGLSRRLEDFFHAFQDLANDPESSAVRQVIKERTNSLASGFNGLHRQLSDFQSNLNQELRLKVDEVNQHVTNIAELNKKIRSFESDGKQAPDLRDRRDLLLDKLSKLVDVRTSENESGSVNIAIGGQFLLVDSEVRTLSLQAPSQNGNGSEVVIEGKGATVEFSGGTLKGILEIRDKVIPQKINQLNELARTLASEVNAIHRTGFSLSGETNINFFEEGIDGAADFAVSSAILNNQDRIAASVQENEPGDNGIALAISELQTTKVMQDGTSTVGGFFQSMVSGLGAQTQQVGRLKDNVGLAVEQLEIRRESVSGVSLDEEMVNMIESQNAFAAAARFITTVDQMTQSVLNML